MRQHTDGKLFDHVTKPLTALEEARVEHIPPGGDWEDLPNEILRLKDGTWTKKLVYPVCPCKEKEPSAECIKRSNQRETLIPWFIEHSGDRNNGYTGLYGRVPKDGVFQTVTTNPRPDGKQGRVLHPNQNRVLTVREFARAQGFPDHYRFCGTLAEKNCQVNLSHMLIN